MYCGQLYINTADFVAFNFWKKKVKFTDGDVLVDVF